MKLSCLVTVAYGSTLSPIFGEKRWSQFRDIFLNFYDQQTLLQVYGYGCYCLNLGDRPLSGAMAGVIPVDDKDRHCFEFTKCNRCVTFDHGPDCTPEQINYNFDLVEDANGQVTDVTCTDSVGTCQNAICECDKDMIKGFANFLEVHNAQFHAFDGGFDLLNDCVYRVKPEGKPKPKMDCCGQYPNRRPYNSNEYTCCDGEINHNNECVQSSFN